MLNKRLQPMLPGSRDPLWLRGRDLWGRRGRERWRRRTLWKQLHLKKRITKLHRRILKNQCTGRNDVTTRECGDVTPLLCILNNCLCNPDLASQQPVTCRSSPFQQIENDLQQVSTIPWGSRKSLKQHPSSELPSGIHQTNGGVSRKSRASRHAP